MKEITQKAFTAGSTAETDIPCYDLELMKLCHQVTAAQCPALVDAWLHGRHNDPEQKLSAENRKGWRNWHRQNCQNTA